MEKSCRSSFEEKVEALLILFTLSWEEGEDISLEEYLDFLPGSVRKELEKYAEYPPRIVIAMLASQDEWSEAVKRASELFVEKLLEEE